MGTLKQGIQENTCPPPLRFDANVNNTDWCISDYSTDRLTQTDLDLIKVIVPTILAFFKELL